MQVSIRPPIKYVSIRCRTGQHSVQSTSAFLCAGQHSYTDQVLQRYYRRLPSSEKINIE